MFIVRRIYIYIYIIRPPKDVDQLCLLRTAGSRELVQQKPLHGRYPLRIQGPDN